MEAREVKTTNTAQLLSPDSQWEHISMNLVTDVST